MSHPSSTHGFSLVELSIVLVILGLLAGGVLTGQSLIRAAELRSVTTEFQKYQSAVNTFRDKYFAIPGDMANATSFWGAAHATPATCITTVGTGTQTCNGNGDGILNFAAAASQRGENYAFWSHLANAGLIEGTYSSFTGAGGVAESVIGTNVPRSKLNNAGFTAYYYPDNASDGNWFPLTKWGNNLLFGAPLAGTATHGPVIKVEEAWNVDTKIDDGNPVQGGVVNWKSTTSNTPNCLTTDVVSTAAYNLTYSGIACSVIFRSVF